MKQPAAISQQPAAVPAKPAFDLAGSTPLFPGVPGSDLASSLPLPDLRYKRLIFNRLYTPGQVHVYRAECVAGERLRVQMHVPVLPLGGGLTPAFALVGQSLPYSADVRRLPVELPAGYSAVVAPPPTDLALPLRDTLTGIRLYPGPAIDTRTLVGGRCYVVVWSLHNHVGKYVLQTGQNWVFAPVYWAQLPLFWWQMRGWFGLSRMAGYVAAAAVLALGGTFLNRMRREEQ